jgi:hypothetical protein
MGFLLAIAKVAGGSEGSPVPPKPRFFTEWFVSPALKAFKPFLLPQETNKKGGLEPSVFKVLSSVPIDPSLQVLYFKLRGGYSEQARHCNTARLNIALYR